MLADKRLDAILSGSVTAARYTPTHRFHGTYLNDNHRSFAEAPVNGVKIIHRVRGSLRRGDAAKIYELAYFANGHVADLGTNRGLSAFIAGTALNDAGSDSQVISVDLDATMTAKARKTLHELGILNVNLVTSEAAAWVQSQPHKFGFVFVDHSHAYDPVRAVCECIHSILLPGAYVAFHDFVDSRNFDPDNRDYKVPFAVRDGLSSRFTFIGTSGGTGIFRFADDVQHQSRP
jgi:predicted O-methyltransferase YrrM